MAFAANALELSPGEQMMQMMAGKWVARAISVAAELGVADVLAAGPKTVGEIATATRSHPPSLYRLLRALASQGIFAETTTSRFELTPLADCLRSDSPHSMRNSARFFGIPIMWRAWEELLHSVRTGETGVRKAFNIDNAFHYLRDHPEEAAIFDGAMTDYTRIGAPALAQAYDFNRFDTIADIAGGEGLLLATILRKYQRCGGILFDMEHVMERARKHLSGAGLTARCAVVPGDFFQSVPVADAYILKHIIHDWSDAEAAAILRTIRKSIPDTGRVLLAEGVIPKGNVPDPAKWLDLEMLAVPGGRERTETEYAALFRASGFRLVQVHPTQAPESWVEAKPV